MRPSNVHLTAEQFIDIAEDAADERSFAHLAECRACRHNESDRPMDLAMISPRRMPKRTLAAVRAEYAFGFWFYAGPAGV